MACASPVLQGKRQLSKGGPEGIARNTVDVAGGQHQGLGADRVLFAVAEIESERSVGAVVLPAAAPWCA